MPGAPSKRKTLANKLEAVTAALNLARVSLGLALRLSEFLQFLQQFL